MKVSASVRALFNELSPRYESLKKRVDELVQSRKEREWHYLSRLKTEESFALKLETGRESCPVQPEDFFACTIVVENQTRIDAAEKLVCGLFKLNARRPKLPEITHLAPYSFDFDDLRLYVEWQDDKSQKPSGANGLKFEFQIKTFLQHAWAVATHDLVYKTDAVNWGTSRIAYQVKASLENAEMVIAEARRLAEASMIKKTDQPSVELLETISAVRQRWTTEQLPSDLRRLALNIGEIARLLRLTFDELWNAVDAASAKGEGTKTLNLSPYGAIIAALIQERGPGLFAPLPKAKRGYIFVPTEIELPQLSEEVRARIIRP